MKKEIDHCLKILKDGGIILYPTDTIWGIGCDATNSQAVGKVFLLKQRPEAKSLIILLDNPEKLTKYVKEVPEISWDLIRHVETPLTIVYPGAQNLAENVMADDKTIAIRIVKPGVFCYDLLQAFGKPLVSTSANISGGTNPVTFRHIANEIITGVDYVVDEKADTIRGVKPSQIIKLDVNGTFTILRK
jgi:L-threonylcarbamoyladenylate synthase